MKSDQQITCPSCQALVDARESFCRECGAPITTTATLDPMGSIHAQGFMLRKAVDGPPKPIVLIGIWIVFLPALAVSVYMAVSLITQQHGLASFVFFWVSVGLAYVSFRILFQVTKNYFSPPRKPRE
jgi:hypothetical protein